MAWFCVATGRSKAEFLTLTRIERAAFIEAAKKLR